jgi:hypothetical protein
MQSGNQSPFSSNFGLGDFGGLGEVCLRILWPRELYDMKTAKISGFMPVTVGHTKRQYLVKFALGSSPAEA